MWERNSKDYILVGFQVVLFFLYIFDLQIWNVVIPEWLRQTGLILAIFGVLLFLIAMLQLNKNLSPFPSPKSGSELVRSGLYKFIRHPIYTGILIAFIGFALFSESIYRILITFGLYLLFLIKTEYEEHRLQEKFSEYDRYKEVTGRFLPKIFD